MDFRLFAIAALALTALPHFARAETAYSRQLHAIQEKYLKGAGEIPILIMDRDELEWRFATARATDDEDKRKEIIKDYVKERTGVEITDNAAGNFDPYLANPKAVDFAASLRAYVSAYENPVMCAIFPPNPNSNQRLEIERILQLNAPGAYGNLGYAQLKEKMSYEDLLLFSILHEAGHCLDTTFYPEVIESMGDPHSVHRSESFAETVAVLLMAKENRTNIAGARASLRTIYAYYMEPYFISHPELGFGGDSIQYGGIIYYLAPVIRAAGKEISLDLKRIQSMTMPEILALAKENVLKNALETKVFAAVYAYYSQGREAALEYYKHLAEEEADLFADTYVQLQSYIEQEDRTKASLFDASLQPPPLAEAPLSPINYDELCADFEKNDFESFEARLDELRSDLKTGNHDVSKERERAKQLMALLNELPKTCSGKKSI